MYVVRRPFRDRPGILLAGSVVEPAMLVSFKSRLDEGHIIEITEQNYDEWASYFLERYGVELAPFKAATVIQENIVGEDEDEDEDEDENENENENEVTVEEPKKVEKPKEAVKTKATTKVTIKPSV